MIKFKKYLVVPLATLMCLSPVFAANTPEDDHLTKLNYTVDQSYKWSAPADITFTTNIDRESKTGAISVTENIIAGNETLKISIASDAVFQIKSKEDSIRNYKVLKDSNELSAGSLVLEVPSGINAATQDLNFELQGVKSGNTSQVAGTYTGTLNFVANIETTGSGNPGGSGSESGGSGGTGGSSGSGGSSTIDMSNVSTTLASGDFSTKGNLVSINGTQYRILAVNGTQAKVMSMASVGDSVFNNSSVTTSFGGTNGQKYAGSNLDSKMTEFYNLLPSTIQDAIIEQNINQTMYSFTRSVPAGSTATSVASNNDDYIIEKKGEINVGSRKVYALDVDDVLEYLGLSFTWKQLNKMVFDTESTVNRNVWLRSAYSDYSSSAFFVYGDYGNLSKDIYCYSSIEVRPAFVLDLSLLS